MTVRAFVVVFWVCLIATAAVAGEEQRTEIKIVVDGDDGKHEVLRFDSADADFDIESMAVGESKVFTDSDGNEVTVLRTEDGFEINLEGETIEIAGPHDEHDFAVLPDVNDEDDVVVEKHKQVHVIKSQDTDGITIISGAEIDADTRAALEKILRDAGKDGDIVFIDGSELGDAAQVHEHREVRVIKKEFDVTN